MINIKDLEKKINLRFNNQSLLKQSLTHKSHDSINSNEKLEFLGDRVLGLIISKKLLEIYPNEKEGILDKKLASLVNKKKCYEIAKKLDLDKFIFTGNNKKKNYMIQDSIVSDCCEALIGAIYLDQGINKVEKFILKIWSKDLDESKTTFVDAKTKLQEYSLKKFKTLPVYKLIDNTGPRHMPIFKVSVKLKNYKYSTALGKSKKEAQQKAATSLLKTIGI